MASDQPVRGRGDDDLPGLGDIPPPDRDVAGLPTSVTASSPDSTTAGPVWIPTHGFSSGSWSWRSRVPRVSIASRIAETGSRGAPCGVLVGHRVAEARQQPLLVALHDGAVERYTACSQAR